MLRKRGRGDPSSPGAAKARPSAAERQAPSPDERFERVAYDPRFLKVPKKISKVKIDKRFSRMMTDDTFKLVTKVDKYGRRIETAKQNQELKDFYYGDDDAPSAQPDDAPSAHGDGNCEMELEPHPQEAPKGYDRDIR